MRGMQDFPEQRGKAFRLEAAACPLSGRRRLLGVCIGLAAGVPAAASAAAPTTSAASAAAPAGSAALAPAEETAPAPLPARIPSSTSLAFSMRSGLLRGQADLVFDRRGDRYAMDLRGRAIGLEILHLSSRGRIGAHGFEPDRYADQRLSRPARVAEFDRAAGRIRYAGSSTAHELSPGCQDRLTWMLQLSGMLEAAPALRLAGSTLAFPVSGARTDLDIWRFSVHGLERVAPDGGAARQALRLTRAPRRPRDTEVEIWLDPARGFLPVRARLTTMPDGDTLELSLRA